MPDYHYWATTEAGDTVTGNISAATPDDASHLLTLRGLLVRRLEVSATEPVEAAVVPVAPSGEFEAFSNERPESSAAMLPLATSLAALEEETSRPRVRRALRATIHSLEQGASLEDAFGKLQSVLPRRMSAIFTLGKKLGRLPELLHHALDQLRETGELRRKIWLSFAYPLCLVAIAGTIFASVIFGIVPMFVRIFDDFGTTLPPMTSALVQLSKLGQGSSGLIALGIVGVAAVIVGVIAVCGGRPLWEQCQLWIPLIGQPYRATALSSLFRMLAVLVEYGAPLPEAFRAAAAFQDSASLSAGADHIASDLEHGITPLEAVRVSEIVPRDVLPIFRWADNRPLFVETLKGAADILAARAQLNCGIIAVIIEPVLLFVIGVTMGGVVIALFQPLIKLLNDLS